MLDRSRLPDPLSYYDGQGLALAGHGKWRTAGCPFHGSSDSLRIHTESGAFVCMAACGARGGDIIAFEMALRGKGFVAAAKALGAWVHAGSDARPQARRRPLPFRAADALEVLAADANHIWICGLYLHHGDRLTDRDRATLLEAVSRVHFIAVEAS